jgi:hypothetical protein
MANPKCFLSYSWEAVEHSKWVLDLARALQERGVYVYLDQWDVQPGMDLPKYMEECVRESNFVLLICTPTFAEKADSGLGGVGYEKSIVTGEIFTKRSKDTKFIPVLRTGSASSALPSYLRSRVFLDFREASQFAERLEELLRHLYDERAEVRPPLGVKPEFRRAIAAVSDDSGTQTFAPEVIGSAKQSASTSTPARESGGLSKAPFNIERFTQLKDFAYGASGLNLSGEDARQWALGHINDVPSFDVEEFTRLKDFAYSSSGLNLSGEDAREWALAKMKQ